MYDRPRTDPLNETELQETILFGVQGGCGYPLGAALKKAYTGLDGRDDRLFSGFKSSISIRVEVRVTLQKSPTIALNPILSGYRTRSGRSRSVPICAFGRGVINRSSRSEH